MAQPFAGKLDNTWAGDPNYRPPAATRNLTIIWQEEKAELLSRIESLESDVRAIMNHLKVGDVELTPHADAVPPSAPKG